MSWNGKIFGIILGAILGGPVGLVIGLMLGHFYDSGVFDRWLASIGIQRGGFAPGENQQRARVQQTFFNSTFAIMGHIAKADGRVSEREIDTARKVMEQMGLNVDMQREAIQLFNLGKQPHFDVETTIQQLKQACWRHPLLLRTFIEIQIQIAMADGTLNTHKKAALERVCQQLGLYGFNFSQFEQRYRAEQNYQRYYQQPRPNPRQHLHDAYQILGVTASASNSEIKKAYRRLMSKHHPDKLIAKGVPPEMIKLATQKTQQIKNAYETIKKARGN